MIPRKIYGDGYVSKCHLIVLVDRSTVLVVGRNLAPHHRGPGDLPSQTLATQLFQPSANTPFAKLDFRNSCWLRVLRGRVCRGRRSFCLLRIPPPSPCVLRVRVATFSAYYSSFVPTIFS